ncbi:hypothetical protein M422DRAFT_261087 [Sphaerobolus stellatus SS14]|uniref:Unplaced genomic scaffold SPHSTscaffold_102, whole genome shotgun sequence n=1 Tax=Sphaerobolus stellatus (strain SS14) TaxID=990650 RepID=A0A0C9V464_SPHS4|nr:hypothetical protein M422DRAFT_261087 [Sphaerobolus stellatus SS14]
MLFLPDYMRAHLRSGLGLRGRHLCQVEMKAKKAADEITFAGACTRVVQTESSGLEDKPGDTEIQVESFTQDNTHYDISIKEEKITSCSCPAYTESRLTCKHMFVALRVTNYIIFLPHTITPKRRSVEIDEEDILDEQRAHKRRLIVKIRDGIDKLERADYWIRDENVTCWMPCHKTALPGCYLP